VDSGQDRDSLMNKVIWMNPGVARSSTDIGDTIFCESGSSLTLTNGGGNVIYLKTGASFVGNKAGNNILFYGDGVSIDLDPIYENGDIKFHCFDLNFDYSNAPPNKAFPQQSVKDEAALAQVVISPNPADANITIQNIPANTTHLDIFDMLGKTVMQVVPHGTSMILDISKLESGTYYLRIMSQDGIMTKKILKE